MEWTITSTLVLAAGMVAAYLLGSINFAIIVTRLFKKGDIRDYGSGNAGMTNVLRTVGKTAALLTLLGDFSKGILSVLFVRLLVLLFHVPGDIVIFDYLVAFAALLGHLFPVFYGFKGGKGVATGAGVFLALAPVEIGIGLIVFIIVFLATKMVSAGSILGSLTLLIAVCAMSDWFALKVLTAVIVFFVIFKHRSNIVRIIKGEENRFVRKKEKDAE